MEIVLGWIQLNCPWHSLVCSVAPDDSQLAFMLSCWYSTQRVNTFFFDSPIYLPLHEQSDWYTPGWLLGSSFDLFRYRMLCEFLPDVKVMSLFTFLNSFQIFGPILGFHRIFFLLVSLRLSLFLFLVLLSLIKASRNVILCPFSTNMFTKNCISFFIHFSEYIVCARCRKPLKTLLILLGSIHEFG